MPLRGQLSAMLAHEAAAASPATLPEPAKVLPEPELSVFALFPGNRITTASWLLLGLTSYVTCVVCILRCNVGDADLMAAYEAQAPRYAYSWVMVAFATAFSLNVLSLLFEQVSSKKQLVLLACYVNTVAASFGFLSWIGLAPIVRDIWGGGLSVMRVLMWLHTTPAMVFLLSLISDYKTTRTTTAVVADFLMISTSIVAHLAGNVYLSGLMYIIAFSLFGFVISEMWKMYDFSIAAAETRNSLFCLKVLRLTSVGLWFTLPATFLVAKLVGVSLHTEEWLWTMADFLGKVTFSSSLLYGNFMTMEERRLTGMRRLEQTNRMQVMLELQDLVTKKERFMSSISHELRTPLNGIIGLSESLLAGADKRVDMRDIKALSNIKNSGLRLLTLINNVLDADSMRTGKLVMKYETVDLSQVACDVIQICQPLANSGVVIKNKILGNLPPVKGDKGRIVQIFFNLIGNSCKFTERGQITLDAAVQDGWMNVSIQDTGIGIPECRFEQIFQAFEQVDMSATRKYGGTGLGLNLVKQLVEAQGGNVSIVSTVDKGTTLSFSLQLWKNGKAVNKPSREGNAGRSIKRGNTIVMGGRASPLGAVRREHARSVARSPSSLDSQSFAAMVQSVTSARNSCSRLGDSPPSVVSEPAPAPRPERPERCGTMFGRKRSPQPLVLSVDDDPVNQLVVQSLLIPEGYRVVQAMDGHEALSLLEEMAELPDVILLDVMMPGLSGYEVAAKLRAQPPYDCIPVIMVSAKSKSEHIVEGLNAGSNDYVIKPFGREELLARVAAHMRFRDAVATTASAEGAALAGGGGGGQLRELQKENVALEQQLREARAECERLQAAQGGGGKAGEASELRHEKELVEKQLGKVSDECERLQCEVDAARAALACARAEPRPEPAAAAAAAAVAGREALLAHVASLQEELARASRMHQQMEVQMEEAEEELMKMHQDKRVTDVALRAARRQLEEQASEAVGQWNSAPLALARPAVSTRGSLPTLSHLMQGALSTSPRCGGGGGGGELASRWSGSIIPLMQCGEYAQQAGGGLGSMQLSCCGGVGGVRSLLGQGSATPRRSEEGEQAAEMAHVLREADLEWLIPKFVAEDITLQLLRHLDDEHLRELGVSNIGSRLRLRAVAAAMY